MQSCIECHLCTILLLQQEYKGNYSLFIEWTIEKLFKEFVLIPILWLFFEYLEREIILWNSGPFIVLFERFKIVKKISIRRIMREILYADSTLHERGGNIDKWWYQGSSHLPTTASLRVWLSTGLVFIWHSYWPASEYLTSLIISCHSPALRSCLTIMRGSLKKG